MKDPGGIRELRIDMSAEFHRSVGRHTGRFIREPGERTLAGVRCPGRGKVVVPPGKVREKCFSETADRVEVRQEGAV